MRKGSDHFKETIQAKLNEMAEGDPLFAKNLEKEDKNIDGCINYIMQTVQKSECMGFTDDEIFGMAAHYYDEDDLKEADPISGRVVVNHKPELSEDELNELKEQARREVIESEKRRMATKKKKPAPTKEKEENEQATLFQS